MTFKKVIVQIFFFHAAFLNTHLYIITGWPYIWSQRRPQEITLDQGRPFMVLQCLRNCIGQFPTCRRT